MTTITEDDVEQLALDWMSEVGWESVNGADIAPDTAGAERDDFGDVILERRLRDAIDRLNPGIRFDAHEDAFRKLTNPTGTSLEVKNESFHRMLVEGVNVEYRDIDGTGCAG